MESLEQSDFSYFKSAMDGLATAQSVVAFVQKVLVEKYQLRDGDQVQLDGSILRLSRVTSDERVIGLSSEDEETRPAS